MSKTASEVRRTVFLTSFVPHLFNSCSAVSAKKTELRNRLFGLHLFLSASSSLRSRYFFGLCTEMTTNLSVLSGRTVSALLFCSPLLSLRSPLVQPYRLSLSRTEQGICIGPYAALFCNKNGKSKRKESVEVGVDGSARDSPAAAL